ncbi:hypothetical protein TNCV_3416471 [Trichonephila clavipes]|nr:hypothetical protein TNCV_3416471 [Trichonephila clavipes]
MALSGSLPQINLGVQGVTQGGHHSLLASTLTEKHGFSPVKPESLLIASVLVAIVFSPKTRHSGGIHIFAGSAIYWFVSGHGSPVVMVMSSCMSVKSSSPDVNEDLPCRRAIGRLIRRC